VTIVAWPALRILERAPLAMRFSVVFSGIGGVDVISEMNRRVSSIDSLLAEPELPPSRFVAESRVSGLEVTEPMNGLFCASAHQVPRVSTLGSRWRRGESQVGVGLDRSCRPVESKLRETSLLSRHEVSESPVVGRIAALRPLAPRRQP